MYVSSLPFDDRVFSPPTDSTGSWCLVYPLVSSKERERGSTEIKMNARRIGRDCTDSCSAGGRREKETALSRKRSGGNPGFENDSDRCPPRRAGGRAYIHTRFLWARSK